jgi:rubredoxin
MSISDPTITCPKCEQASTLDAMTTRPITGDLPPGQFQCPKCGYAFRRAELDPGFIYGDRYIPGRIALVQCEARL